MGTQGMRRRALCALAVASWLVGAPLLVQAQVTPPNNNQQQAGVVVDASGVLRKQLFTDPTGELTRQRLGAARAALDPRVAVPSKLRKISLNRLEAAIKAQVDKGGRASDEMLNLAGLTRLQYVFYYPDTKDIVIAGPAEGWAADLSGRVRGMASGQPILELQDLVVALRMFPPDGDGRKLIGCSIDPTPEGLSRMQAFLREVGASITPDQTDAIVEGLRTSLGMQNVRIMGVPPKTHFAQVMVEADYRMKLIGIGLERPPVRLASYVDRASPSEVGRNALQRWYFVPDYRCVRMSEDALSMELVGDGVKLVGEDEVVVAGGGRRQAGRTNRASQAFVNGFTKVYGELADREPVYAQLRNLIDMAVAAAFIQQQGYYGQAEWQAETLMNEAAVPVETYESPVQVETVVTSVWKGARLMTPVGGGVTLQPELALDDSNLLEDNGTAAKVRSEQTVDLPPGSWWWD